MKKTLLLLFKLLNLITPLFLLCVSHLAQAHPCKTCTKELAAPQICSRCGVATYCDKTCQVADWPSHKSECKKLAPSKDLRGKTRIAPSSLKGAGMGVFANQDLEKNSPVAGYYGTLVEGSFENQLLHTSHAYLQPFVGSQYFLLGSPTPPAPHLAAQLANDPYVSSTDVSLLLSISCSSLSKDYLAQIKAFSRKYMEEWVNDQLIQDGKKAGKSKANLDLESMKDASHYPRMIARRAIAKDEELYYDYGLSYWLGIAINICNKKGFPLVGTTLDRVFSESLEEEQSKAPHLYSHLKMATPNYISKKDYMDEIAFLERTPAVRLIKLLGSANLRVIDPKTNPAALALNEFTAFSALVAELDKLPNSEFISPLHYGTPHPKTLTFLKTYIEHLKSAGISDIKVIEDLDTERTFSWPEFFKIFE